jgi:hypothetical protein
MAFKDRSSGMFGFGAKTKPSKSSKSTASKQDAIEGPSQPDGSDEDPGIPASAELATVEEREALLRELSHGFVHVGSTIQRLDENLAAGTRSLEAMTITQERLPALLAEQQHLIHEVTETANASRRALEALGEHLQQRDAAQQAIVERLESLGKGMAEQRDAHRQQLDLVMGFHRSSRLFMGLLVFGGFVLVLLLVGALLFVLLRPHFAGSAATSGPQASPTAAPAPAEPTAARAPVDLATPAATPAPVPTAAAAPTAAQPAPAVAASPAPDPPSPTELDHAAASAAPTVARRAREALTGGD